MAELEAEKKRWRLFQHRQHKAHVTFDRATAPALAVLRKALAEAEGTYVAAGGKL